MLGIFLVVDGDRGSVLVFHYPPYSTADELFPAPLSASPSKSSQAVTSSGSAESHAIRSPYDFANLSVNQSGAVVSQQQPQQQEPMVFGHLEKYFVKLFVPHADLCGKPFEMVLERLRFIGHPVLLPTASKHESTFFHVVFVLSAFEKQALCSVYKNIATKFALAIEHEQKRCGYFSQEVQKMLKIRDEFIVNPDRQLFTQRLMEGSNLARHMQHLCTRLDSNHIVSILLNDWIDLRFVLQDPTCHPHIAMRPYQSLLFLYEPKQILAELPPDGTPAVRLVVTESRPQTPFSELSAKYNLSLHHLFRIAAHLVYWQKARLICALNKNNVYVVSPRASARKLTALADEFRRTFGRSLLSLGSETIYEAVGRFSAHQSLKQHFTNMDKVIQAQWHLVVLFLLRHDLLLQLHTFYHLVVPDPPAPSPPPPASLDNPVDGPPAVPTGTSSADAVSGISNAPANVSAAHTTHTASSSSGMAGSSLQAGAAAAGSSSSYLSPHEREYLESKFGNLPQFPFFKRLCRYFRGRHPLEEIIWREGTTRADVEALRVVFSEVLIKCTHEWTDFTCGDPS